MNRKLEHLIIAVTVLLVLLGAWQTDLRTRLLFDDARVVRHVDPAHGEVVEQEVLAQVVALREPVIDPFTPAGRVNPERGEAQFRRQPAVLRIMTGLRKGRVVPAQNRLHFKPSGNPVLAPGVIVRGLLTVSERGHNDLLVTAPVMRYPTLLIATAGLLCLAILFFRLRGICFAAVLLLAYLAAVHLLFPLILQGYPPFAATAVFAAIMMILLVALLGRPGRKTAAAILGASVGLAAAVAVIMVFSGPLRLSGYPSSSALMLKQSLPEGVTLDFVSLLACGTLICVLGLVLDLGVGIASSVEKVYLQEKQPDYWLASRAGIRMSRDVTGTMLNTLVFVWAGTGLTVFMLPRALQITAAELINSEQMAMEILRLVAGGIGLAVAGPATALIAAALFAMKKQPVVAAPAQSDRSTAPLTALYTCIAIGFAFMIASTAPLYSRYTSGADASRPFVVQPSAEAYHAEGRRQMHDHAHAMILFWKAIDNDASFGPAHRDLARIYSARRWFALANDSVSRALELMPDDSDALCIAGVTGYWLGDYDNSEALLRRALELDASNGEARQALKAIFDIKQQETGSSDNST